MITVTVHEPPSPPSDRLDRADRLMFVKDGYHWVAAAWPPLWFIGRGLWLPFAAYFAVVAVFGWALASLGVSGAVIAMILVALHLLIGLEADSIVRWDLDRTGWQVVGTVVGRNLAECERRFFDDWLPQQPIIRVAALRTGADGSRDESHKASGPEAPGNGPTGWRRALGGWSASPDLSKLPTERG
jgi:Protein of unknown function (DUF2628)